jgi:hypothetical protein
MGKDSASSAQLKHAGGGETTGFGASWGELGQTGGERWVEGEHRAFAGGDGVVDDAGGVYHASSGKTARLRGWGELGGLNTFRWCSDGPGSVFRHFAVGARGPEWCRVRGSAVIDGDVAVERGGSRCGTGVLETSWGEIGCLGGLLVHRRESWGRWGCSVKGTTCFDEHVCSWSRNVVVWAVDRFCTSFRAW